MKGLKSILGAFAVVALLGSSFSANAQENGNRDENGNIVRGSYETNLGRDNWFIGVGGGLNASYVKGASDFKFVGGPAVEGFVGKWFTPSVGARVGYRGLKNSFESASSQYTTEKFPQNLAFGDLMWNVSNALSGYKETRFWDVILYGEAGMLWTKDANDIVNHEWALGAGWLNDFRLGNHVDLYLDIAADVARAKTDGFGYAESDDISNWAILPKATVGLIFNLGRTNWDRHTSVAPAVVPVPFTLDQYNALKNRVAELEKENAALKDKLAQLQNARPDTVYVENDAVATPAALFFDLNKDRLSARELAHLEYYATSSLNSDSKVTLVGSADKETGTSSYNMDLSQRRADYVKSLLVDKYGLSDGNITVRAEGDTNNVFDTPAKNRVVTIKQD